MKKYPVGEAIFFPFTMHFAGLKDLRRHTYHALLAGIIPERFFIAAEETAPAGSLDLFSPSKKAAGTSYWEKWQESITGHFSVLRFGMAV